MSEHAKPENDGRAEKRQAKRYALMAELDAVTSELSNKQFRAVVEAGRMMLDPPCLWEREEFVTVALPPKELELCRALAGEIGCDMSFIVGAALDMFIDAAPPVRRGVAALLQRKIHGLMAGKLGAAAR